MVRLVSLSLLTLLVLSSCSLFGGNKKEVEAIKEQVQYINEKLPPMKPMVLRVTGYGAVNERLKGNSTVQKKLMAMRASKLDAYRSLAERVYGTAIIGNTTVQNLVVQDDRFKSYVDTFIYGAKVIAQDELMDGTFETVLEMVIDEGFRNCLVAENQWRENGKCASEVVHELDVFTQNNLRRQGIDGAETGLYFIE